MKTRELDRSGLVSATDGMNDRLWRKAVIRQKEAEAELVAKAPDPQRQKGGDGGNCPARRGPRPANIHPRPSRELAGFDDQVRAKASSGGGMIVLNGCSATGAGTNPPHRSVHLIGLIHS